MIEFDYNLQPLTTFRVHAPVAAYARFTSLDALQEILSDEISKPFLQQVLVLGGGSNMLFTKRFDGLVLKNECKGITLINEDEHYYYVQVGGGENWHQFVIHCIEKKWAGVENLSLIPGSVGASPIQNIGAYGVEIKDVFHSLEAYHLQDDTVVHFSADACAFGYRESVFKNQFKNQFAILSVTFRLNKHAELKTSYGAIEAELQKMDVKNPGIADVSNAVIHIRQSKLPDPAVAGNAGSFFKNPMITTQQFEQLKQEYPSIPGFNAGEKLVKVPAAWLIEQCGWKGYRKGDAGVNALQPLVLVNYGAATGNEIFDLSSQITDSVDKRFYIQLEREVNIY